jgi:N6-L-threonylcarbamoyladenine synthase
VLALGIETSCDETAAAVVEDGRRVRSSVVLSQAARHEKWRGVVPDIAAREHTRAMLPVLRAALDGAGTRLADLDLIAVTSSPGLVGSLLLGVAAAEGLAVALGKPVVGVNHVEAHLAAPFLATGEEPRYPLLSLVVSGGHTHLFRSEGPSAHCILGATLDDAAGESFDKVAAMLGLPYPGGPSVERLAREGDPAAFPFKRPAPGSGSLDWSFSGLKTAVRYRCFGQHPDGRPRSELLPHVRPADVAASFQAAVVEALVARVGEAVRRSGIRRVAVGGGVACNGPLRARLRELADREGLDLLLTPPDLCTDNAAMVAAQGTHLHRERGADRLPLTVSVRGSWPRCREPVLEIAP